VYLALFELLSTKTIIARNKESKQKQKGKGKIDLLTRFKNLLEVISPAEKDKDIYKQLVLLAHANLNIGTTVIF
jgi:hypothetical protein